MTLSPAAIAGLVVLGSAVAGVSIGFAVAAGLSDACVLNPQSCVVITFRRGPNNTLLVENGQYAYWFDGALIFAYGSKLPGVCPSIEALHATSTLLPVPGAPLIQNRCTRFAEDGKTCVEYANFCRKFSEEDPNTCLDCVTSTACTADTPAANRVMDARRVLFLRRLLHRHSVSSQGRALGGVRQTFAIHARDQVYNIRLVGKTTLGFLLDLINCKYSIIQDVTDKDDELDFSTYDTISALDARVKLLETELFDFDGASIVLYTAEYLDAQP